MLKLSRPYRIIADCWLDIISKITTTNIYTPLKDFLSSAEFADLARIHPEAFTRQRALSLPHRVSMRLKLRKGSIGDELDRFFGVLHDQPLADGVSPSAFCHARMQLDPRALLAFSRPLLEGFERDFTPRLWA